VSTSTDSLAAGARPRISLVIPCYNEEESVDELVAEVIQVIERHRLDAEVIIVDDGSRDRTWDKLVKHAETEPRLRLIRFRRNFGQTAAMVAGHGPRAGRRDHPPRRRPPERPQLHPRS
jgi:glycosyltransferase involved in cell wall biosynthesis